ncbi:hypothetical protein HZH68_016862 [Vespula germanica]|uniref:Uncharacterized protein n=1 Tax=Vespula germanica TaxID=30212 RepID=A0A834J136_VESGE|nr:hypothetical protein HZH68_016862 [Vespula germanica]
MFRNWILQDLSHAFPPRSLQTIGTTSFHTNQIKNRGFWNLFEFSRKENNSKDAEELSDNKSRTDCNSTKTALKRDDKLNDVSKDTAALSRTVMTNSNKVYSFKDISKCNYTFRYVPRIKSKKKNSKTNFQKYDEFTSLLDGNFVPTNMKLKLKGYKTLRNEQAKDFAFIPGDKSLDLDIIPTKNEEENISYQSSKPTVSMDVTKLQTVPLKETKEHSEIESNILFPSENKISMNDINPDETSMSMLKHTSKKAQESSYDFMNVKKKSETRIMLEESILPERKETKTESLLQLESQNQVKSQIEPKETQKGFESKVQQLQNKKKDEVRLQSDETTINYLKEETLTLNSQDNSKNPSKDLSKQADQAELSINSLNRSKTQNNFKESDNVNKIGQSSASYFLSRRTNIKRTLSDNSKNNSSARNLKDNATAMSNFRSSTKIPRYSMYESRKEQQRRASSPCDVTFIKARENSTKQRWSGFDRPTTRCYPGGSSGSHNSRCQGSTHPYPSTVQTREVSSKCHAKEKDPIVRSNIISSSSKMLKTRNSVTGGSITPTNIDNRKLYSNINSTKRTLLGSKSSTGLTSTPQSFAYGCCKKPKKSCQKKCKETCDEPMIPGKIICTKPRTKCCQKPKCCRTEKKPSCTKVEPPPPRPCCQKKKKKICKRYCCPSLKVTDCIANRATCPGKCTDKAVKDDIQENDDPSCLSAEELSCQKKNDCDNNDNDCCSSRNTCCSPKKCNKSFSCMNDKDEDCIDSIQSRQDSCCKPKKKDCCNRSCKRSKSCGNRRYHSGTKSRRTKSHVSIPIFDVSVVVLRPYQNDPVLRFYSTCENDWKPPSSCKKDKQEKCKSKCKKPEPPNCLNAKKSNCDKLLESLSLSKDSCDKPKKDPCTVKKTDDTCCQPKTCDQKDTLQARWDRELQEIKKCKNIGKNDSCKKTCDENKCNKFESIDLSDDFDLRCPSFQLSKSFIPFCLGTSDSSLLNFGMKSNNIIPNRSFSMTKITKDIYRDELPILVETELPEKEWADEESSSE